MIRIAITMLRSDRAKCTAMILAVTFSVFLMQNQCAILASLYRMMTAQIDDVTDAPLWVMEPDTRCFEQAKPVKDGTLERVRSRSGVAWAVPLLKIDTMARSDSGLLCTVTVMGVDEASMVGLPSRFRIGQPDGIRPAGTCAVDPGGYAQLFPGEPVQFPRRIRIGNIVVRQIFTLKLVVIGEGACNGGRITIKRRRLVGVLAVAHLLHFTECQVQGLWVR